MHASSVLIITLALAGECDGNVFGSVSLSVCSRYSKTIPAIDLVFFTQEVSNTSGSVLLWRSTVAAVTTVAGSFN